MGAVKKKSNTKAKPAAKTVNLKAKKKPEKTVKKVLANTVKSLKKNVQKIFPLATPCQTLSSLSTKGMEKVLTSS